MVARSDKDVIGISPINRAETGLEDRGPSATDIAWAAGLFEGEGCFTQGHGNDATRTHLFRIIVVSTDLDVLERFKRVLGVGRISPVKHRLRPHHKQQWRYDLGASVEVLRCVELLYPYLGIRRRARADELASELRRVVSETTRERSCPTCGIRFSPRFGGASAAQIYCSVQCGYRARNDLRRRVRRAQDPGPGQIGFDL